MATNLALNDTLTEEARQIGKHSTKKEAVTAALRGGRYPAVRNRSSWEMGDPDP